MRYKTATIIVSAGFACSLAAEAGADGFDFLGPPNKGFIMHIQNDGPEKDDQAKFFPLPEFDGHHDTQSSDWTGFPEADFSLGSDDILDIKDTWIDSPLADTDLPLTSLWSEPVTIDDVSINGPLETKQYGADSVWIDTPGAPGAIPGPGALPLVLLAGLASRRRRR